MGLCDEVRTACARIAARSRLVRIDAERLDALAPGPAPALDPRLHFTEGSPEEVAAFTLALDTINFGSGWWPTIRKRPGASGYQTIAGALTDRWRAHGPWSPADLRALDTRGVADALGQDPDHELMALYAQALRDLGSFLGRRGVLDAIGDAGGSAERFAARLVDAMELYEDPGLYKRAQIAASDLALVGAAEFDDLERLTIFADNLVPHVLRVDGVLVYAERLAAAIDAGEHLGYGYEEREIRGCAVHACAQIAARLSITERELDGRLWARGHERRYKAVPRHRCRCTAY